SVRAPEAKDDRPLAPLELAESRHRRRERKILGIRGVDAGDQGLSDALERLAAQPAADERAEALVILDAPRQDEVERHADLAGPGEETGFHERPELRRREELESVGQRVQTPAVPHEDLPEPIVRPREPVLDVEPAAERERPGFLREKRIGTGLDQESAGMLGR